jgi:hypothetical protein
MKIEKRLLAFIQDIARFYTKKLFEQKIVYRPTKSERKKKSGLHIYIKLAKQKICLVTECT